MDLYRVDMAFYVRAEGDDEAREFVENEMGATLAADYDFVDVSKC